MKTRLRSEHNSEQPAARTSRLRGSNSAGSEKTGNKKSGRKRRYGDFCAGVTIAPINPKIKFRGL
jgi:hypothetical protein